MSPHEPPFDRWDCGSDAAAYALGALTPAEAAAFRRHLDTCIVCGDECVAFAQIVDALALAIPLYPVPRGLRRRVMREVRMESSVAVPRNRRHAPRARLAGRSAGWPAARAGGLLAAAALALIGALQLVPGDPSPIRSVRAQVSGPAGSARLSVAGARAELIVSHLPSPAAGRIYEVWVERAHHAPSPRALFGVTGSGAADVRVPGDVRGASAVMVTEERAGGSLLPTRPPVIVAKLA